MFKKLITIITIIIIIILLILNCYLLYDSYLVNEKVTDLEKQLETSYVEEEYLNLYKSLKKEIGDVDNIDDKIGLLKREYNQNEEALEISAKDLENIKKLNNEVESKIIYLENLKKEEQKKIQTNLPTYNQFPKYPTGCESVGLYLLLKYYNVNVSVNDIVTSIKKGSLPYNNNGQIIGGDPEIEFVGDPRNNYSYGTYNKPIEEVAEKYKSGVISKTNFEFSEVVNLVNNNHPVLVWTTINLSKPFISRSWITKEGKKIEWISGEHVMVIFKVVDNKVVVSDPYTGTIRYFDKTLFEQRYNYLGKRAIYYE